MKCIYNSDFIFAITPTYCNFWMSDDTLAYRIDQITGYDWATSQWDWVVAKCKRWRMLNSFLNDKPCSGQTCE